MARERDTWWQNTSWNERIAAAFISKLARARNKAWYLRNQGRFLASSCPGVALRLLEQFFALGGDYREAEAHFYRARLCGSRRRRRAVAAYEAVLVREEAYPNFRTWAFHELRVLIATERMSARYDRAIEVLMKHKEWVTFPVQSYQWHGALALILHERGQPLAAADEAKQALETRKMTHSGFDRNPHLGLVGDTADNFGNRLRQMADEPRSGWRWWRR